MSAAVLSIHRTHSRVLPRVWATASLATAVDALRVDVQQRKRPHCLRLVRASAAPVVLEMPSAARNTDAGLAFYRKYTEGLLRRYAMMSMEAGRVPSLLGRELFRGKVTSYKVHAFDDAVIFVHDVGKCLAMLDAGLRHLVRRISIEGYTREEAAALLGISLRTVFRRHAEAIDKMSRLLLDRNILEPLIASLEED